MEIEIVLDNMEINIDGIQYTLVKKEEPIKVGDWVRINKPKVNLTQCGWRREMDVENGRIIRVESVTPDGNVRFDGWYYHPSWLTKVEAPKWRAEEGHEYFFLTTCGDVITDIDVYDGISNLRFNYGNYFQTIGQAKEAAIIIKKALLDYQETLLDESK